MHVFLGGGVHLNKCKSMCRPEVDTDVSNDAEKSS